MSTSQHIIECYQLQAQAAAVTCAAYYVAASAVEFKEVAGTYRAECTKCGLTLNKNQYARMLRHHLAECRDLLKN